MLVVVMTPEKVKAGRAKGHYCKQTSNNDFKTKLMSDHKRVEAGDREDAGKLKLKSEMTPAERVKLLREKLYCKAKQERKSQRKSRLYGKRAFEKLVCEYGLIDPMKYFVRKTSVKACN